MLIGQISVVVWRLCVFADDSFVVIVNNYSINKSLTENEICVSETISDGLFSGECFVGGNQTASISCEQTNIKWTSKVGKWRDRVKSSDIVLVSINKGFSKLSFGKIQWKRRQDLEGEEQKQGCTDKMKSVQIRKKNRKRRKERWKE